MARQKIRGCCIGGQRHTVLGHRRYVYASVKADKIIVDISEDDIGGGGFIDTYYVARNLLSGRAISSVPTPTEDFLCWRGHWVGHDHWDRSDMWTFHSARAADDFVRRLNAGLPLHRDRWLGFGAVLFLAAEIAQAIKLWS